MPQVIGAAVLTAANVVGGAVYGGLTGLGVGAATASIISQYAVSVTLLAGATLSYVGPALLFAPKVPTPEFGRSVKRQPIPDRVSGYGRARLGGAYMLYETDGTNEGLALNVFAMHDGLIAGWGDIYLNDQTVVVGLDTYVESGTDLRYGKEGDLVRIETRLGEPTETNYSAVNLARPDVWPTDARGDGIASLMMIAKAKFKENFTRDYPNGLPLPSAVGDLQYCWDPRLGARGTITDDADKAASATWVGGSQNPFLQLLDYMTNPDTGMGLPLSRFLPNIAAWEAAADVCDEAVPLAAGGTVPRYQSGGSYLHATAPADVIATILATCDGWLAQDATGCFTVQAGEYVEPVVSIGEEHIVSLSRQFYREDERATNEIVVSYTDPNFDYTEVQTTPWRREADIAARGHVRSQPLALPWVQNNSQARRLAKIAAYKATAPVSGVLTTTLDGLRAWSERRIRIQAPSDGDTMSDIVVDLLPLTLNPDNTVSIPFVSSDPDAYDWTTAEETAGAGDDTRPGETAPDAPVIDNVTPFALSGTTERLRIYIEDSSAGQSYLARWRTVGDATWTQLAQQIAQDSTPHGFIETGVVTSGALEVEVALVTAAGVISEWSATFSVESALVSLTFPGGPFVIGVQSANQIGGLADWSYSRAGVAYAANADGTLSSFATDAPRITDQGLLIEDDAENLLLRSQAFDNAAWVKYAAGTGAVPVVTANAASAPDGTMTADQIAFSLGGSNTSGDFSTIDQLVTVANATPYRGSVWLRAAAPVAILCRHVGSGGYTVLNVTTAWQRFVIAETSAATSIYFTLGLRGGSFGSAIAATVEIWGGQLEQGTSASSYIPTDAAAVVRPADSASIALPSGNATDEIVIDWTGGSVSFARSTLSDPAILNIGGASGGGWVGTFVETVTMTPA
jgi:hypothetical protein